MSAATPALEAPPRFEPALMRRKLTGTLFYGACLLAISLLLTLLVLLYEVLRQGLHVARPGLRHGCAKPATGAVRDPACPRRIAEIGLIVGFLAFPVGIAAAIYLEEYATDSGLNRLLQTNIRNLAGVPSIIYGILGLGLFVRLMGLGPTVLSGALTLTLLILPIVIIASIEALRAVPQAQREGAYALGATRWQVVRRSVLPAAAPGIMTGIILAMARAIGEAAPLIVIGAFTFVTFLPNPIAGQYTVLPIQIYGWAIRPQADFQGIAAAAIIVILILILALNGLALIVRARLSKHIQW